MPKGVSFLFYIHMKQKFELEIDCPEGCKPIVEGTTIKFVSDKPDWKEIKKNNNDISICIIEINTAVMLCNHHRPRIFHHPQLHLLTH